MMDAFDSELTVDSFEISHENPDEVIISSGPKNGFLWRGEAFEKQLNLIECLKKVFTAGFTQRDEQSALANLPYVQSKYPDFICASNTYCNNGEFTGLEQEQLSAGTYGYTYLIDLSKKNIHCIPLCEENLGNPNFVANYSGEINEGPDYAIISKLDPKCIIGAVPSAFALGLAERSFVMNPVYQGIFNLNKITEVLDISLFSTLSALALKYPNLPIDEVYRNYLRTDEEMAVQTNSPLTFFPRQPQSIEPPSASSEYNSYQCKR